MFAPKARYAALEKSRLVELQTYKKLAKNSRNNMSRHNLHHCLGLCNYVGAMTTPK